jgi:peptidyl-tRNA hydrolase, PTH1 family
VIRLVVGLGNPGQQYKKTRHNAGFLFLDQLVAVSQSTAWQFDKRFQAEIAECVVDGCRLILLKPQTYMNLSGVSVEKVMSFYKLRPEEVLVIHDELELPLGSVKLKVGGGHSGHNGLRDIIAKTGSPSFRRLRIGIGRPIMGKVSDYVLASFSNDEEKQRAEVCNAISLSFGDILKDRFVDKL